MDMEKEEFLSEYGRDYGYPDGPKSIDQIRATEFNRLSTNGTVYLDHAGATLYSELQMEAICKDLTSNIYANPHSQSDSSMATSAIIRDCRQQVLDYFNASANDYKCIFTSGATAALKMVGEAFPWSSQSCFMYTMENHNSVVGIREYALDHGARASAVEVEEFVDHETISADRRSLFKVLQHPTQRRKFDKNMEDSAGSTCHLFAFPSECNFSGIRFNLDLVKAVKKHSDETFKDSSLSKGRWLVLIDAAKGCATEPPDLSKYSADFVVVSFYKVFGYPSGLGALVVRNEAAKLLKKTYFSGGTVAASIADIDFVKHRDEIEELFEDGTASFLSIISIRHGFQIVNTLTVASISRHTSSLARYLRGVLSSFKHDNGMQVCILYGDNSKVTVEKGPIVSFNLKRPDGTWFGYREVEKLASLSGIQLRTGCFCNPGACSKYLGLSHLELLSNVEAGHVCWDDFDIVNGKPTGAVRVSFGYMSTFEDTKKFIDFIKTSFVALPNPVSRGYPLKESSFSCNTGLETTHKAMGPYLKSITVYPIKSCAGFSVDSWPLSNTGLLHDREWLLKSPNGEILTQKMAPEMSLISTFVDLRQGVLLAKSPRCKTELKILLKSTSDFCDREDLDLHGHRYELQCYNHEVNSWFSNAVGRSCTLWRSTTSDQNSCKMGRSGMCRDMQSSLSFVNEAQFLLVSESSVADLNSKLESMSSSPGYSDSTEKCRNFENLVIRQLSQTSGCYITIYSCTASLCLVKNWDSSSMNFLSDSLFTSACRQTKCVSPTKLSQAPVVQVSAMRFRPNLVISGGDPYNEDLWRGVKIGSKYFVSLGGCNRCQMINFDHQSGHVQKTREPLATLASYRRVKGRILFGILLRYEDYSMEEKTMNPLLQVGEEVHPDIKPRSIVEQAAT